MLVDNAKGGIDRHSRTDRPLNKWHEDLQVPLSDVYFGNFPRMIKALKTAEKIKVLYKQEFPRVNNKKIETVEKLIGFILINHKKFLQLKAIPKIISARMLKEISEDLEKMGFVEISQGYSFLVGTKYRSTPSVIRATLKLLQYED